LAKFGKKQFFILELLATKKLVSAPQIDMVSDSDALLNKANIITELVAHYAILRP